MRQMDSPILVSQALAIRATVLRLLSEESGGEDSLKDVHDAPGAAWRLFHLAESSAMTVGHRLRERGQLNLLSSVAREALDRAELSELQRVLAARQSLRTLEETACRLGVEVVVFKGGALAAGPERRAVDLGDIDVLVVEERLPSLWSALLQEGWRVADAPFTPSLDDIADRAALPPLHPAGPGLPLEIHRSIHYARRDLGSTEWPRGPLQGFSAIRRLEGLYGLEVLLRHSVIQHPHRRGHLRDLIVIAEQLDRIGADANTAVAKHLAGDPYEAELLDMLNQASALRRHQRVIDSRATLPFLIWKYEFALGSSAHMSRPDRDWATMSYVALERPQNRRARIREQLRDAIARDSFAEQIRAQRLGFAVPESIIRLARAFYRCLLVGALLIRGPLLRKRIHSQAMATFRLRGEGSW